MTKIYTKTGDTGETALFGGGRVKKNEARVDAYGEVDELNACLGVARAHGADPELDAWLGRLQAELFTVGSMLATPRGTKAWEAIPKIQAAWIADQERAIDTFDAEIGPLTSFIMPGGTPLASALHLARTVCRRAERKVVALHAAGEIDVLPVTYLNRLSDLLFTLARVANKRAGVKDVPWTPPR
ncbi:MAG: cob(I)yrinic acid a,c-diamide adenosyltransferase [Myxococcaceae bacterium]|nr:cob(I)yrinic acid a,c-diamide adenosyltransferase [Myxococcaceae bacterium]